LKLIVPYHDTRNRDGGFSGHERRSIHANHRERRDQDLLAAGGYGRIHGVAKGVTH